VIRLRDTAPTLLVVILCSGFLASTPSPLNAPNLDPAAAQIEQLRQHPGFDSEPFVMANLLRFANIEARDQYFREYAPGALQLIRRGGGEVVWAGMAAEAFVPGGPEPWDHLILVRWPSRSAFLRMLESPEYGELKGVRDAALAETMMLIMSELGGS
jgi:uncharacterized protein (DUF1330 family)